MILKVTGFCLRRGGGRVLSLESVMERFRQDSA